MIATARKQAATASRSLPTVRPATIADIDVLTDMHVRCMGTAFDTVNREFSRMVSAPDKARRFIEGALNDKSASVMILHVGSRAVGYAVARVVEREFDGATVRMPPRLEAIGVMSGEQGNGYGRILLRNAARAMNGIEIHTPVAHGFFRKVAQERRHRGETELVTIGSQGLMAAAQHMGSYSLNVH
ncbi:MAG: hypothetical protein EBQ96_03685 [Proteobacteria bacterium]|nr:hypothetical protein [Pseudomonadota bacterium]